MASTVSKNVWNPLMGDSFIVNMDVLDATAIIDDVETEVSVFFLFDVRAYGCRIGIERVVKQLVEPFDGCDIETSCRIEELFGCNKSFTSNCHQASPPSNRLAIEPTKISAWAEISLRICSQFGFWSAPSTCSDHAIEKIIRSRSSQD